MYFTGQLKNPEGNVLMKIGLMKGRTIDTLQVVDAKGVGNININGFINLDNSNEYSAKIKLDENKYLMYDKNRSMLVVVNDFGISTPLLKI